jgi:thymidylate synthase
MKNGLDEQYIDLLKDILNNGVEKNTRNGKTLSVFGRSIRYKFKDGKFPLLTTKKMAFKTMVVELLWFLRGETNIKFLLDYDCHIWDGDAYKNWFKNGRSEFEEFADHMFMDEDALGEEKFHKITKEWFINKIKTDNEFAKKWGSLGKIYGAQWRKWGVSKMESKGFDFDTAWEKSQKLWKSSNGMECGSSFETFCMSLLRSKEMGIAYGYHTQIDQIQNLINDLKTNPDSRRLMVNSWNVGELNQMVLPPCHYGFQVYTRELSLEERIYWMKQNKSNVFLPIRDPSVEFSMDEFFKPYGVPKRAISLMFNMRSTDVGLGLGFNLASYGLLLMMIAKQVNMVPDELIYNGGDVHLYKNHIEPIKEQLNREPYPLPIVKLSDRVVNDISDYTLDDIVLENYQSHPTIKMPLSN